VQIHRHRYRGQIWFVLQDHVSGRFHRFSPLANFVIGMLDGQRTVEEIWTTTYQRHGDDAPTQDEIISLLTQLHAADVLLSGVPPDLGELKERTDKRDWQERVSRWRSPLSVKLPLLDPERWLNRWRFLANMCFSRGGAMIWLLVVGFAAVQCAVNWPALTDGATDKILSLENLFLIACIFPFAKAFHELGHALAVKKWGGEVHEVGVMFLVLVPIPYVDASQSSAFRSKYQRVIVGAAGMLFELLLAALAMFVWLVAEPGTVRALAYNTMLIAGVSTLFFNGNPLLRFDGYYMLMDWLEIPNLASRANRQIAYMLQRYLYRLESVESPAVSRGEARWLAFFAIASFLYRMFIMFVILVMVASQYFIVGIVLAIWAGFSTIVLPLSRKLRFLFFDHSLAGHRAGAVVTTGLLIAVTGGVLALVPFPHHTMVQGIVWTPEESWVRAGASGFVESVAAVPGDVVEQGQVLIECQDATLAARVAMLQAEVSEVETRYIAAAALDRVAAARIQEELQFAEERLADARREESELSIKSTTNGVFVLDMPAPDLPGHYFQRGTPVAYVVSPTATVIRVVVPQKDVDLVRHELVGVEVRLSDQSEIVYRADVKREIPGATDKLPSLALGIAGGGSIVTDPGADGQRAFQSLFQFDVEIQGGTADKRLGQRAYVRFEHGREPLAYRWYRTARRLFLKSFNV
jgi:putative peptide zinc metalloprotease protein